MENDGRMASSMGLSYKDLVDFLSIGNFPTILAFDGGGSSTIYTNLPGFPSSTRLNNPSDGSERRVGNALLFVKPIEKGQSVDALHLYPNGKSKSELLIEAGRALKIDIRATDAQYDPADFDLGQIIYTSELGSGSRDKFVAGPRPGSDVITGTYSNGARGSVRVKVVNNLVSISSDVKNIDIKAGQETKIGVKGHAPGKSYDIEPEALNYELSSPDLGTINESGIFVGGDRPQQGEIKLSFGDKTVSIPVNIKDANLVERIAGDNRYETASLIAQKFIQSPTVLLANSGNFPDALVAANLAYILEAPILLTDGLTLSEETRQSLVALGANKIVILGGENSVSASLQEELDSLAYTTERISGTNRYETAVNIAKEVENKDYIYLASGENYPDALAITSLSTMDATPVLLTSKDSLSEEVKTYISEKEISKIIIAGGQGALSANVYDELVGMGLEVERIAGSDRYETSALIAARSYPKENGFLIANGNHYIDALTAGPLSALNKRSILLVKPESLPGPVEALIQGVANERISIIGGVNSVNKNVKEAIELIAE